MARILAGSSCKSLGLRLSQSLALEYIDTHIDRFADAELRIQITKSLLGQAAIILQSTSTPANDHLMELLLLVDAAKHAGAQRIITVVPYFGYSRQDRPAYEGGPISARLVANLFEAAGVDYLITCDLHSEQSEGFFNIRTQNIDVCPLFASYLREKKNIVIVSPDIGGARRAKRLAHLLNADIAILNKVRKSPNVCEMQGLIGNVSGKKCILIDDVVDTGGTLCQAVEALQKAGSPSIEAFITHSVLSKDAIKNIQNSALNKVVTTETIMHTHLPDKFVILDIIPLIKKSLEKVIE